VYSERILSNQNLTPRCVGARAPRCSRRHRWRRKCNERPTLLDSSTATMRFLLWLLLLGLSVAPTAQQDASGGRGNIAAQMGGEWKDVPYKVHSKLHDDCLQGNVTAVRGSSIASFLSSRARSESSVHTLHVR
jgi:hypothetical protein